MIKCKSCGAYIEYDPNGKDFFCPYCGTRHTINDLTDEEREGNVNAEEQKTGSYDENDEYFETVEYTCPRCGGTLYTTEETISTFCSYCGSPVMLEKKISREKRPKYIIPFKVTREQAADAFRQKTKKAIFAPNYIKGMNIEKIRGIYMPYLTYTGEGNGHIHYENRQTFGNWVYVYANDADFDFSGSGIEHDAASTFPDDLSECIAPYYFAEAKYFEPAYMSGFYADAGDMTDDQLAPVAAGDMIGVVQDKIADHMKCARKDVYVELDVKSDQAMYPVWFLSGKSGDKVSYAVVNGQTGRIGMDIPVDIKKLLLGTLILALPIFALLYLLITPTPRQAALGVAFFAVVGLIAVNVHKKLMNAEKKKIYLLPIFLAVLAILISLVMAIWNPFRDEIYYTGIVISGVLSFIAYCLMFMIHNLLTKRKPAQLGKRGGDEDAE